MVEALYKVILKILQILVLNTRTSSTISKGLVKHEGGGKCNAQTERSLNDGLVEIKIDDKYKGHLDTTITWFKEANSEAYPMPTDPWALFDFFKHSEDEAKVDQAFLIDDCTISQIRIIYLYMYMYIPNTGTYLHDI